MTLPASLLLTGAGLSRLGPHRRAHTFFSQASWDPDRLGLRPTRAVVEALLPVDAPVPVVIDDILLHRVGEKVFGWQRSCRCHTGRSGTMGASGGEHVAPY
ncbi:transposase [Streptomyces sp. NPDC046915]|uniref:transposase n=1 Tax=Streptomyces sp. NPDC046915 TaxID=3155257 RepID=UPI0033CC0B91